MINKHEIDFGKFISRWDLPSARINFEKFIGTFLRIQNEYKGSITNISSMVGQVGQPNAGAYSATKGGQIAMTKNMAIDFAPYKVRANVICPGWIATPLVEDWFSQQKDPEAARKYIYSQHPLGRIGTIEECGYLAAFLASDEALFITGAVFDIDGGVTLGY